MTWTCWPVTALAGLAPAPASAAATSTLGALASTGCPAALGLTSPAPVGDPVSTGDLDRVVNSLKLGLNDLAVINLKNKATQQKTTFFQQPPGYIYNSQTGKYTQQ